MLITVNFLFITSIVVQKFAMQLDFAALETATLQISVHVPPKQRLTSFINKHIYTHVQTHTQTHITYVNICKLLQEIEYVTDFSMKLILFACHSNASLLLMKTV